MAKVSVLIPIYNMKDFVLSSFQSLEKSGLYDLCAEVLYIDDGSSDGTREAMSDLSSQYNKVRVIGLDKNQGRYLARKAGAEAAQGEIVVFVDARVDLAVDFAEQLRQALATHSFIQPQVRIDIGRNVFCLYWERSHEALFRRHYQAMKRGHLDLTPQNYDDYLKGTTVLVAPRGLFLEACQHFGNAPLLSDDTALMRWMVERVSLRLEPRLWAWWVPREDWRGFIWRLYDRGPGLVEYHVFERRGWIFAAIMSGLFLFVLTLLGVILNPYWIPLVLAMIALISSLSLTLFTRNPIEWLRLWPLHFLVLWAVGLGVLKGLLVNCRRWMKGELSPKTKSVIVNSNSHSP